MPGETSVTAPKTKKRGGSVKMGAKICNQLNTNQQSNMALSAYSAITQNCSTININFA